MKKLFCFCFILISVNLHALTEQKSTNPINIGVSPSLPPYVFSKDNSGLQLELIKAAFKSQGVTDLNIIYMSNKRVEYSLEQAELDVAVNYAGSRVEGIYPSQSLLSYQNVAVSLAKNNFKINSVYALTGKSVLAFQNATAFLPHPYKRVTTKLNHYEEVVNQAAQVDHLMKEWVDVVVLEKRVFLYYLQQYQSNNEPKEITIHPIFSEAARPAYFNNKSLQELFDMGLDHIKQSGEYNAIMAFNGTNYATAPDDGLVK
ncbi:substrate-binding periplasmic protein [Pseudoalteromonas atlantica]|uniref:substrate-binding periplasmic protein n=1 Tax=Pseudoalteromonas atlantica TaxID=288 RepID=UPI0037369054